MVTPAALIRATRRNSPPRRILMTSDTVGGVWTYSLELARALAPYKIEIMLATMGRRPTASQRANAAEIENLSLIESEFKLEWMHDPWSDMAQAARWLLDIERTIQPDIVHLNGYSHAALPWGRPVVVVAHSCVVSWWHAVRQTPLPDDWCNYRRHVKRGIAAADLVVAPSRSMARAITRNYGVSSPVEIIYNSAQECNFHSAAKESFVFSAGRIWDEAKNIRALVEASNHISWPVVIAGEGNTSNSIDGSGKNVRSVGLLSREAIADYMARSAIYAMPAVYEPFGLSILEAALSGCALVLGDIPSLREIWGPAAVYIDPRDSKQLADKLEELIHDEPRRHQLAEASLRTARTFSPRKMGAQYLAAYQRLLSDDSAPPSQTAPSLASANTLIGATLCES